MLAPRNKKLTLAAILLVPAFHQLFAQQIPYYNSAELIEKGVSAHDKGNYKEALEWYRKVPEGDTNYLLSVYEQSLTLIADTNYEESIRMARKALDGGYSNRRQLLLNIASAHDGAGRPEEAMRLYDSCAALYPHDYRPWYERAVVAFKQKAFDNAERFLQQSLLHNPYHYRSHYMLGNIYALEGRLSEAMLALQAALLCTNDAGLAQGPIGMLNAIASGTDEVSELYSNKEERYAHPLFDETDQIVVARLALNKAYALKTPVDDDITRQIQVVLEKLRYNSKDTNFAMQYYVPVFRDVYQNDQFDAFVLLLFSEYGIESIDKVATARKGKARLEEIKAFVFPYLNKILATRVLNYKEREKAQERYHYIPDEHLMIEGLYADKQESKLAPGKVTYYKDETLAAEGGYGADGKEDGPWTYYYASGRLKMKQHYKNGILTGQSESWYANGNLRNRIRYDKQGNITRQQSFSYEGYPEASSTLRKEKDYEITYYYPDSTVQRTTLVSDDKIKDGTYQSFYPTKKVKQELSYKGEQLDGHCKSYYEDGSLKESYTCSKGKLEGLNESWYPNGKQSSKYNYAEGLKNGTCEEYYEDGSLSLRVIFANGKEEGVSSYYNRQGKLYGTVTYKNGQVIAAKFTAPDGKPVMEQEDRKGISPMTYYNTYGTIRSSIPINGQGQVHGNARYYYPSGQLKEETAFVEDRQEGPSLSYYKNGSIYLKHYYVRGTEDGYYQYYGSNGTLRTEGWQKDGTSQGEWHNYSPAGVLSRVFFLLDGKLNGPEKNYESDGRLNSIVTYDYGMILGLTQYDTAGAVIQESRFEQGNGIYISRYPGGATAWECDLRRGDFEGPFTMYAPSGIALEKGGYHLGKREGPYTAYYNNGNVRYAGAYKNGNRTGTWSIYAADGSLENETEYREGNQEGKDRLYAGGMLRYETDYYRDEKHGASVIYGEDKKVAGVLYFEMGALTGYSYEGRDGTLLPVIPVTGGTANVRTFYAGGQKAMEFNFTGNCYEGSQKLYFSNGQLAEERMFSKNNFDGPFRRFNPDGSKLLETRFTKDLQQGTERKYNSNGILISSMNYKDGELLGPARIADKNGSTMIDLWYYYNTLQ